MKIGVMLRHLGEPGGIGMYTTNLLDNLLSIDTRNDYLLFYQGSEHLGRYASFPNVSEYVLPAPSKLWWDQVTVPKFGKKHALDIIYNPKLSVPLFTRSKTVLVMHGADQLAVPHAFKWHDRFYFTLANRVYCRRATAIIATTRLGANDIKHYMGASPEKIRIINMSYNETCRPVEHEEKKRVRAKYSLPEHFILFLGGLEPKKNLANLLRAYSKIKGGIPHKLVVVGFRRWKYSGDFKLVEELGIEEDVVFLGFSPDEDVPAIYNVADLFVLPSYYEGFGMPVLEAMACACPVITTKTGCSPEVAGDAALLVDPASPDEIAEAMRRVFTDQSLRQQLIERGLKRVSYFSWKRCAEETLSLFESLMNGVA